MARKDPKTCNTCRRRKVKCDGAAPTCGNCNKLQLHCEQPDTDYRFLLYGHQPLSSNPGSSEPEAIERHARHASAPEIDTERREMQLAAQLSQRSPQIALLNPIIANAFSNYVEVVAPWYDLTDSHSTFGAMVAMRALDFPVLFRAIIALSCCNLSVTTNQSEEFGFAFHAACVEDLITAVGSCPSFSEEYLAAACLLQLYEILDCRVGAPDKTQSSPAHLLGAYSFLNAMSIDLSVWNLGQAGFWNYLREETFVALVSFPRRPIRLGKTLPRLKDLMSDDSTSDDMRTNLIIYMLAQTWNHHCEGIEAVSNRRQLGEGHAEAWRELMADLDCWTETLPATFRPFSTANKPGNAFPSIWLLKPWHVCGYQSAALMKILLILSTSGEQDDSALAEIQELTIRVCSLAFTTENQAVRLNSIGLMLFCGRYLTLAEQQIALEDMLIQFARPFGYPLAGHLERLKEFWERSKGANPMVIIR